MGVLAPLREEAPDALMLVQRQGAVEGLRHVFPQATHPFPTDTVRARWVLEMADPAVDCFAVMDNGRLAGFAATSGEEFLHFGTAVETWGTGLAGRAHDEVVEHLRDRGSHRAHLRVFDENHRAVRFYRRRGWTGTDLTTQTSFPPHPTLRRYELALD